MRTLRILHTADWHLGKRLADVERTDDFRLFLDWLLDLVEAQAVDVLLISGDVFDTTMPATDAQRLYYEFLSRAASSRLLKTVVTAGNHDSQRFLSAPKALLGVMNCLIAGEALEDEAFVIRDRSGEPLLGVAAVPYLREGDVRASGQSASEAERFESWSAGVAKRYRAVREILEERLAAAGASESVPRVAMGHLFVAGSRLGEAALESEATAGTPADASLPAAGTSERESHYVGTLRNASADAFGADWDYVALGHIHAAQTVKRYAGLGEARYCGAPLALAFKNERYAHQMLLVEIDLDKPRTAHAARTRIVSVPVPQPRRVGRIRGNYDELLAAIEAAAARSAGELPPVLDVAFELDPVEARALIEPLRAAADKAGVVLGPIRATRAAEAERSEAALMWLEDITPEEVFEDVLGRLELDEAKTKSLKASFAAALAEARDALGVRRETGRGAEALAEIKRLCEKNEAE